jgi:hypothetical protein
MNPRGRPRGSGRGRGSGSGRGSGRGSSIGSSSSTGRGDVRADDYDEFRGQTPPSFIHALRDEDETTGEVPGSTPSSTASGSRTRRGPNQSMATPQNPAQRHSLEIGESGR